MLAAGGAKIAHLAIDHAPSTQGDAAHAHACGTHHHGPAHGTPHTGPHTSPDGSDESREGDQPVPAPERDHSSCDLCLHLSTTRPDTLWMSVPQIAFAPGVEAPAPDHATRTITRPVARDASPRAPPRA